VTDTMLRTARMLPVAIAVVGLVLIAVGEGTTQGLGAVLVGVGALVALVNLLSRLTISSESDRARERRARRQFARTGRWPRGEQ